MSIDDSSLEEQRRKRGPKRRKVNHACLYCRRSHMTCDEGRPCQRCIKREIGHLCHDEPKNQSSQPQQSGSNSANNTPMPTPGPSTSSLMTHNTLGEAHAAHLQKFPDQGPPLLEIMHGFPVPAQAAESIPFGGAPNPHVQHYPQQHQQPQQQSWQPFMQDAFSMSPDGQGSGMGNELTALHTFIANFGDGQAFFGTPQTQTPAPQAPQPHIQQQNQQFQSALPSPQHHQNAQHPQHLPNSNPNMQIDPSSSTSPTSATSSTASNANAMVPMDINGQSQQVHSLSRSQSHGHGHGQVQTHGMMQSQSGQVTPTMASPVSAPPSSATSASGMASANSGAPGSRVEMNGANMGMGYPVTSPTVTSPNQAHAQRSGVSGNQSQSGLPTPTSATAPTTPGGGIVRGPAPMVPTSKQEAFLLTAADQASGSRDERLSRVIRSKYEAGLLKPYNYVNGYSRLSQWMERNVTPESKRLILEPLSVLRPKFRAVAQSLTDMDLVMIEEAFERLLLDYDRVFSAMAIPACLWRRTGEIYKANREFAELIGVEGRYLREGQLTIYELMDEEAAVNYWEKYGHVAFDTGQKAVLTTCVLRYKPALAPSINSNFSSGGGSTPTQGSASGGTLMKGEEGFIRCCFSFTIRRDAWGIPTMIVGNFIRL